MKRFVFSLAKVLEYRKQLESDRQLAFSKAAEIFRRREDQLRTLAAELTSYQNAMAKIGTGRISARELALYRSYLTYLETQVGQAVVWLQDSGRDLETRRRELAVASQEKQVLEKVKDSKRAEHDYQLARQETADLDEIGSNNYIAAMPVAGAGDSV